MHFIVYRYSLLSDLHVHHRIYLVSDVNTTFFSPKFFIYIIMLNLSNFYISSYRLKTPYDCSTFPHNVYFIIYCSTNTYSLLTLLPLFSIYILLFI